MTLYWRGGLAGGDADACHFLFVLFVCICMDGDGGEINVFIVNASHRSSKVSGEGSQNFANHCL